MMSVIGLIMTQFVSADISLIDTTDTYLKQKKLSGILKCMEINLNMTKLYTKRQRLTVNL